MPNKKQAAQRRERLKSKGVTEVRDGQELTRPAASASPGGSPAGEAAGVDGGVVAEQTAQPPRPPKRPTTETWDEAFHVVVGLLVDLFLSFLIVGGLQVFHTVVEATSLPVWMKEVISFIHLATSAIVLLLLPLRLILRVARRPY